MSFIKGTVMFRGITDLKNFLFCRVAHKCGGKVAGQHA